MFYPYVPFIVGDTEGHDRFVVTTQQDLWRSNSSAKSVNAPVT
jgi:hypothetical protein